ncbi:hypothetical protein PAE0158 [Pyrobaculum aerophilum str. IM2]|uniref:Uncharacterized protein n=3 Tax=Pyrobaculum aerophilum TaxID=13773 RepID=Q8ZZN8_PYRAE|nr:MULTISPECIES: hypothetical protein [Pyrobaculum]AAL62601.1 hypothetical protein PAE0158 [Pyrobaculum aerophilum str. IM2]HII46659.1 hypothetical protein [Pyrobaculum aerophilum]
MVVLAFFLGLLFTLVIIFVLYALRPHVFNHMWLCGLGREGSCRWLGDLIRCANCDPDACARISYELPPKCGKERQIGARTLP